MDVEKEGSCQILGSLGFLVQMILGVLSFTVLIIKRFYEKPKRKWRIWILDASKQGVSALVAHMLNVILAIILSMGGSNDACIWYFITVMFDTTVGVLICYFLLQIIELFFGKQKALKNLKSGNYLILTKESSSTHKELKPDPKGHANQSNLERQIQEIMDNNLAIKNNPNTNTAEFEIPAGVSIKIDYLAWFIQLLIWNIVVIISKSFLYFFQAGLSNSLESIGNSIFGGLSSLPVLKLIIVMVIIPLIMNSFQFWIQDNFLKKSSFSKKDRRLNQDFYEDLNFFYDNDGINFNDGDMMKSPSTPKNNFLKNKSNKHQRLEFEL